MKDKKTISIKRGLLFIMNAVLLAVIVSLSIVWYFHELADLESRIELQKANYKQSQREYLQNEVNQIIYHIDFLKSSMEHSPVDSIQQQILLFAQDYSIKYGGYIFINQTDGKALLFDGKIVKGTINLLNLTDPTGKRLFDIELAAYNSNDGQFMEYLFKPLESNKPEPKLSYMKGFKDWNWIIGAGFYVTTPDKEIAQIQEQFTSDSRKEIAFTFIILLLVALISWLVVRSINRRLVTQIKILTNFLQSAAHTNNRIDTNSIKLKELKKIGTAINHMIDESRDLNLKLQEKDHHIRAIFEAADNIGFVITDLSGEETIVTDFSPGAEKIFGFKLEEIKGQKVEVLHRQTDVKEFPRMQDLLKKGLKGFQGETTLIRKSGKEFAALFTVHPLFKADKIIGTIGVTIDISQRKRAETELRKLKESLEQKILERTKEIQTKNEQLTEKNKALERYHNLFVGREFRIKELKDKLKQFENKNKI